MPALSQKYGVELELLHPNDVFLVKVRTVWSIIGTHAVRWQLHPHVALTSYSFQYDATPLTKKVGGGSGGRDSTKKKAVDGCTCPNCQRLKLEGRSGNEVKRTKLALHRDGEVVETFIAKLQCNPFTHAFIPSSHRSTPPKTQAASSPSVSCSRSKASTLKAAEHTFSPSTAQFISRLAACSFTAESSSTLASR